ncbi:MAG: SGNH hydrolase [Ktedonobacteraceae bacterium]|nr:SGNH hydrolase [Ktedonobacteraceae bacterium]
MRKLYFPLALLVALCLSIIAFAATFFLQSRLRTGLTPRSAFTLPFFSQKAATVPVRILPLGDSLTAGVTGGDPAGYHGGYRLRLWEDCKAAGWNIHFVGSTDSGPANLPDRAHEGHPGWRTDQISSRVVGWLKRYQPQIILLHIGTNDLIQGYSASVASARLNGLVNQITTTLPSATLIVAQIIPIDTAKLRPEVIQYNRFIPTLVQRLAEQGKHIRYVDMYDAVPVNDLVDHIHPNADGYYRMAQVWFQALKPLLSSAQSV